MIINDRISSLPDEGILSKEIIDEREIYIYRTKERERESERKMYT